MVTKERREEIAAEVKAAKDAAKARAREVAKRNGKRPELQPVPMRAVPCPGQAHSPAVGGMQDHCVVCMPNWGQIEIPAAFPNLETYRRGDDVILQAAAAHAEQSEPDMEVGDLQQALIYAWRLMTPEQRARLWEECASIRQWHPLGY